MRHYGVAVVVVAFATLVRLLLDPLLGDLYPYATVFLAVLFSASHHGFGPGLAATICGGLLANYFLIPPRGHFSLNRPENK
jgi:K+-sensing histidine kinase KdpD